MFTRTLLCVFFVLGWSPSLILCQQAGEGSPAATTQPASATGSSPQQEFPAVLEQKVTAGKTPAGTHVQGTLMLATLVNGKVIPRNAVLSGEIVESKSKTSSDPARLSIRLDSAQWKNGSATIHAFLTPWFYVVNLGDGPELHGPDQGPNRSWNGMGQYPDPHSPAYKPFPSAVDAQPEAGSGSGNSKQRTLMKNVECERDSAGTVTLVDDHSNLKLDKLTVYVFGSCDAAATAKK